MALAEVYVGDVGLSLRLEVTEDGAALDISSASTKQIKILAPDGRVLTKTASFVNSGSDGLMHYLTIAGDLDIPGRWRYQGYLAGLSSWTGHTSEGEPFQVRQPLG